jgi:hypothetical protein
VTNFNYNLPPFAEFVERKVVARIEMMSGVTSLSQIVLPKTSFLRGMDIQTIIDFCTGFVAAENGDKFLAERGITKAPSSISKALPYVLFTLPSTCSSCGGHSFARKMSSRSDYRFAMSASSHYGFSESTMYYCTSPTCRACYTVEKNEHSHGCTCRECVKESVSTSILHELPMSAHWAHFVGINDEHRRLLHSNVSLSGPHDKTSQKLLTTLVFDLVTNLLRHVTLLSMGSRYLTARHFSFYEIDGAHEVKLTHDWRDIVSVMKRDHGKPAAASWRVLFSWVRSALSQCLPDDKLLIANVCDYCIELVISDPAWANGMGNAKSAAGIKLCERLKGFPWDDELYRKVSAANPAQTTAAAATKTAQKAEEQQDLAMDYGSILCSLSQKSAALQSAIHLVASIDCSETRRNVDLCAGSLLRETMRAAAVFGRQHNKSD